MNVFCFAYLAARSTADRYLFVKLEWIISTGLHPAVGVIAGKDSLTGTLYGISNTGEGYVMSEDDGRTWQSISAAFLAKASSAPNYVNATFADY